MNCVRAVFAFVLLAAAILSASATAAEKVLTIDQAKPRAVMLDGFEKQFDRFVGAWAFTAQIAGGLTDCKFLLMDGEIYTGTDNKTYLVVEQAFTSTGLGLLSRLDNGKWMMLFDAGTSYYRLYQFDSLGEMGAGLYWLYETTGSPTGAGSWMRSFRFADPDQVVAAKAYGPVEAVETFLTQGIIDTRTVQHAEELQTALQEVKEAKLRAR